jgi:hypothetical protein
MSPALVGASVGPSPAAFRRRSGFVAYLQASRDGFGEGNLGLDGRAAETSRPDCRAAMGCSPTINVRHIDSLRLREKTGRMAPILFHGLSPPSPVL